MSDTVSVIVPAYNVASYLHRCLDSLLVQSYADLEIIVVDDGSTDTSGDIADDFARRDTRVRVIHQKNQGPSSARNVGLTASSGLYVLFVDGDDWVSPELVRHLRDVMTHKDTDIVVGKFVRTPSEDVSPGHRTVNESTTLTGADALRRLLSGEHTQWTVACGKLFRRSIIGSLRFAEGRLHEDEFFTYRALADANTVALTEAAHYFYRIRAGSTMASAMDPKRARDALDAYRERANFIASHGPQDLIGAAREQEFRRYLPLYRSSAGPERTAVCREMRTAARILHSSPVGTSFRVFATAYAWAPSIVDPLYRAQLSLKCLLRRGVDTSST